MKNRKLIKNYIYNTLYQILVLITPLITTPYVSRILGVTNIGIYQYTQSIATYYVLVGAVGTNLYGQREIAYLQDKPRERSIAFWEIVILRAVSVGVCLIGYVFAFCLKGKYPVVYSILSIEVLATALDISWLFMGMEDFKLTVIRNTIIRIGGVILIFLFVKSADDLILYVVCVTLPIAIGNLSLWFSLKRYIVKTGLSFQQLVFGIRKRIRPVLTLFLPQIAIDVYVVLDKTMIGLLATNIDQVGYYAQAQKIVKLALAIVTSLGTVMLPAMSSAHSKGDHEEIISSVKAAFRLIYLFSFPLLFGLCAIAPRFVPIFFGDGYAPVAKLLMVISPILVIIATSNVLGKQYLLPTDQQKAFTASILTGAGVNILLNVLLIPSWNALGASVATVLAEIAVTVVQCCYSKKQLPLKECMLSGTKYAVFASIMFLAVRGIDRMLPAGGIMSLLLLVGSGAMVYFIELLISKDPMLKAGFDMVKKR